MIKDEIDNWMESVQYETAQHPNPLQYSAIKNVAKGNNSSEMPEHRHKSCRNAKGGKMSFSALLAILF